MTKRAPTHNLGSVAVDEGGKAAGSDGGFAESMMRRAIELTAATQPHPNPRVGAVVVSHGVVVGEGAHLRAGEPHAEVIALEMAKDRARNATLYVTLEPCSHHGRTPPCSEAVIDAGIAHVVVGALDPDTRVSGRGIADLTNAGVQVETGVLREEVERRDPGYFHHRRTGRPLVTLKLASTLDGQIAAADRTSKWITGTEARRDGHRLRAESDVVIVGAGTVLDDDPRLDVRLDGYAGRQPRPVVVAGSRSIPDDAAVFDRDPLLYAPEDANGRVDLAAMIADLGERGYVSALVEGGASLAAALVRGGHVDRIVFYFAAKLGVGQGIGAFSGEFATIGEAVSLQIDAVERLGGDIRVEASVVTS